jgi:adenylate cyclase
MSQIVFRHDGTIDKFMGDGLMAMWNAPLADPDHASKAVFSALRMVRELEKFNQTKLVDYRLKIGIGANTGEVIVGNVGSDHRMEYTAIGSNVNLASRIESLTGKYGAAVLVSEQVFEQTKETEGLIFRLIDIVTVKGNHRPMRLYEPMLDTPENRDKKYKYEKAYYYYQRLDWATAYDSWREVASDPVAVRMIERIMLQGNLVRGNQKWDGVWRWSDK